jgi:hypothetical protein
MGKGDILVIGVFAVDRGIWEHPMFAPEPYTEREAWLWLVGSAVWKPTTVRVGRRLFKLERGQLAFSERFLATKWQWSRSRVNRFLVRLKNEAMAIPQTSREATHLTICNYNKYAFDGAKHKQQIEPQTEPLADHCRAKEEEGKELKKEEDRSSLRSDVRETVSRVEREQQKQAKRLPEDWQPSVADINYAKEHGADAAGVLRESAKFKNHWLNKSGKDAKKLEWWRAWQNWVLGVRDWGSSRGPPVRQQQQSFQEIAAEIRSQNNVGPVQDRPSSDATGTVLEGELLAPPMRSFG